MMNMPADPDASECVFQKPAVILMPINHHALIVRSNPYGDLNTVDWNGFIASIVIVTGER
jgi:hypothetical protein